MDGFSFWWESDKSQSIFWIRPLETGPFRTWVQFLQLTSPPRVLQKSGPDLKKVPVTTQPAQLVCLLTVPQTALRPGWGMGGKGVLSARVLFGVAQGVSSASACLPGFLWEETETLKHFCWQEECSPALTKVTKGYLSRHGNVSQQKWVFETLILTGDSRRCSLVWGSGLLVPPLSSVHYYYFIFTSSGLDCCPASAPQ